jgi:hypothetical protein
LIVFYNSFTNSPTSPAFKQCESSIKGADIAHGPSAQAALLCAATIQYKVIGRIYFAILFISLQFIVIKNSNSK